jgi:hypothetical protein
MRLLPRTTRGTVTLAAAAWLVAVGVLWEGLPVRPRATFALPPDCGDLLPVPGGERLVAVRFQPGTQRPIIRTGPLRVIELAGGRVEREFLDESVRVSQLRVAPDGRHLAVEQVPPFADAPDQDTYHVRVFDLATGREFHEARAPRTNKPGAYFQFVLAGDGRTLAYSNDEGGGPVLKWWDYAEGREVAAFPGFGHRPLAASADGRWLAAVAGNFDPPPSRRSRVTVWDIATRRPQAAWDVPQPVHLLEFSQNGAVLLAVSSAGGAFDGELFAWEPMSGQQLFYLPRAYAQPGAVTPDGDVIGDEYPDQTVQFFRWGAADRAFRYRHLGGRDAGVFRHTAQQFPGGSLVAEYVFWDRFPYGPWLARKTNVEWFRQVREKLILFDGLTGERRGEVPVPTGPDDRLQVAPDSHTLVTRGKGDTRLEQWDVPPRKPLAWFLAGAVLLALPPALLARWRVRRLRRPATTGGG